MATPRHEFVSYRNGRPIVVGALEAIGLGITSGTSRQHRRSGPQHAMSTIELPEALKSLDLRPLFSLELRVAPLQTIGALGDLRGRVGAISSGRFAGRLSGQVLPGGSDWQSITASEATHLDARIVLETDDGEQIGMEYRGVRRGPPEVLGRLARGEPVAPTEYYFRITASFSTAAPALTWLNEIVAVGTGHRLPHGPVYNLFEVA